MLEMDAVHGRTQGVKGRTPSGKDTQRSTRGNKMHTRTHTHTERERERERGREKERQRERKREKDRERERQT